MNEIVSINDWKKVNQISNYLLLITKESCEDCRKVEGYLKMNNNKINEYNIKKIAEIYPGRYRNFFFKAR